jgi:hypothetical protein
VYNTEAGGMMHCDLDTFTPAYSADLISMFATSPGTARTGMYFGQPPAHAAVDLSRAGSMAQILMQYQQPGSAGGS